MARSARNDSLIFAKQKSCAVIKPPKDNNSQSKFGRTLIMSTRIELNSSCKDPGQKGTNSGNERSTEGPMLNLKVDT